MKKDFSDRVESEAQTLTRITNDSLICKDCQLRFDDRVKLGNTSTCKAFSVKPNEVILGGPCVEYVKEE